jgi:hypothetical protein
MVIESSMLGDVDLYRTLRLSDNVFATIMVIFIVIVIVIVMLIVMVIVMTIVIHMERRL